MPEVTAPAPLLEIGRRIRMIRSYRGLSQQALAEQIGCNPSYLSLVESGRRTPSLSLLLYAIAVLGAEIRIEVATTPITGRPPPLGEGTGDG